MGHSFAISAPNSRARQKVPWHLLDQFFKKRSFTWSNPGLQTLIIKSAKKKHNFFPLVFAISRKTAFLVNNYKKIQAQRRT